MTNIVRKLRPTDYWRIGEHESWFSDMSLQGLHLHKMGTNFAHFKKGEPKRIEYRIEVVKNKSISDEKIDMYEENGWDYVTSYNYFHVFASPVERNATELHTDPAEQAYTLQQLSKRLILNVIVGAVGFAFIIGMLGTTLFLDGTPVLRLVEGFILQQMIMIFIILYLVYLSIRAMLAIRTLRRNLKEGKAINHHAPWEKTLRKNTAFSIVFVTIALASTAIPWIQIIKSETFSLPEGDSDLPLVRLANIEQNPMLVRDEYYMRDGIDRGNRYSMNWSLFAPVQYESDEHGVIEDKVWLDESDTYSPSINTEVYQLTFQAFAAPLVSDLIKWHSYGDETEPYVEKNHLQFDQLIIHEEDEKKELFASKGKVVMFVRYYGYAEMESIIENTAQKIRLLAEK